MSVDNKLCGARIQAIRKERKMTAGELAERVGIGEVSLLHIECGSRGPSLQTLYSKNANVPVQQGRAAMCVASTSALPYIESDTMEGITIDAAPLPAHKNNCQLCKFQPLSTTCTEKQLHFHGDSAPLSRA